MQAWNWLMSLSAIQTQCRIFIHHTPTALSQSVKKIFSEGGATLVEVAPFGQGPAAYCNKIRQLETTEFLDADFVILSDADIAFVQDPALLARKRVFRAKTVDLPNPPQEIWSKLFERAGLGRQVEMTSIEMVEHSKTFATNFNGGLYVMPTTVARSILPLWQKWAAFCLEQHDLLGDKIHHSDQLGMGMALLESKAKIDPLPSGANLPTHLPRDRLSLVPTQDITALHYHSFWDQHGLPKDVGIDWFDASLSLTRNALTEERRKNFSNDIFWDFRYSEFPELGSGLGSRDKILLLKQDVLRPYVEMIGEDSILDVGCGDLEVFASLPAVNYTGIDVSNEALEISRAKRADWTFQQRDITDFGESAFDYCCCIDVLIHQKGKAAAEELVRNLVRVAKKGIIFSCHTEVAERSTISFDSAHLRDRVAAMPEITSVRQIAQYRDTSLYFARIKEGEQQNTNK